MNLSGALFSLSALPALVVGGSVRTANIVPEKGVDFGILEGPSGCAGRPGSNGLAHISQEFANKLMGHMGFLPVSPSGGNLVQTSLLTSTTHLHIDNMENEDGVVEPVVKGTPVAFVTVNTNEDAYFSQGDTHIPIVEGQVIQFDGSVEHNTVIESGVVMLLGPFELPTFSLVGVSTPCADRDVEECCVEDDSCYLCPESNPILISGSSKGGKSSKSSKGGTCNFECVSESNEGCATCNVPVEKNFYPFIPGQLEDVNKSPEGLIKIVRELEGNLDGTFGLTEELVSLYECGVLRDYADSELDKLIELNGQEGMDIQEDFRFEVSPSKLETLISLDSIRSMFKAYKNYASDFPVSRVVMRRTSLNGDKHIQYHNDGDTAVMHVWLNEDGVEGGNLVYLNRDGVSKVEAKPGAAALHGDKIVHGITPLNGTRYILILLGDSKIHDDVLEPMMVN